MNITHLIIFAAGALLGAVFVWLWSSGRRGILAHKLEALKTELAECKDENSQLRENHISQRETNARLSSQIEAERESILKQREVLKKAEDSLRDAFKALSADALNSNNRAFLDLAKKSLDGIIEGAQGEIEKKTDGLKNIMKPLEDTLSRYEKGIQNLEKTRAEAYGGLKNQLESMIRTQETLQKETGNLVSALRRPEVRGRWGEVALKRVVELAGMTAHVDFSEQVRVKSAETVLRPDMVVHLPAGREVVIDSKVATDAYLDAIATDNDAERKKIMAKHGQHFRQHMRQLAAKSYWNQFEKAPEYVVMFIPGESFLSAAVEHDPRLIEDGMENNVIIATPTTLISLLRAVAYGWRQEQVAKHAQEIARLAKELYDRFRPFVEHVNTTGGLLSKTVVSFNKMIMSLERRVLISVRKFKDLGATGDRDLEEISPVEQIPMISQEHQEHEVQK